MRVVCLQCGAAYDDVVALMACPHDEVPVRCMARREDGHTRLCRSVSDILGFLMEARDAGYQ